MRMLPTDFHARFGAGCLGSAFLLVLMTLSGGVAAAQVGATGLPGEVDVRGTSYYVYTEPGAPTVEIVVIGETIRNGVYRLETGTTLVQTLALAGGTARSDSSETEIRRASIAVLRSVGGMQQVIYQAPPDQLYLHPERHPELRTGDMIRVSIEYEAVRKRLTFLDGLDVAARVASVLGLVLLIVNQSSN